MGEYDKSLEEKELNFNDLFLPLTNKKVVIFIIIIGIIVFFNMLSNGFVWDDLSYIVFNPDVHKVQILALLKENSFNNGVGQYRAVTAVYFALLYSLFHNTALLYHSFQLCIHIGNSIVLFVIFKKFFNRSLAFVLSLLFLIHPMQVESVSFIASSDNPLFFLFGIVALLLILKRKITSINAVVLSVLLLLSLLTKETGIGFVFLVLLYGILFQWKEKGKVFISGALAIVLYFAFRVGIGGILFNPSPLKGVIPITNLSLAERLLNIPAIIFYYIKMFMFPVNLAIDQQWIITTADFPHFYGPLMFDVVFFTAIILLGIYLYKKKQSFRTYLFFLLWFLGGLGIHLQILPLDMTVADRWFYFPMAGLLGLIGLALSAIKFQFTNRKVIIYTIAVGILLLLALRTIVRNTNWSDNLTLFAHDAKIQDNYELENNVGSFLSLAHRYSEALPHTKKSTELYAYDVNLANLGFIYEQLHDYSKATVYYRKAITTKNLSTTHKKTAEYAYLRLSGIYLFHGKPEVSKEILLKALESYLKDGSLWAFLAMSDYNLHQQQVALTAAEKAKILFPSSSTTNLYKKILNKEPVDFRSL